MIKKMISVVAAIFILTGCASGVTRAPNSTMDRTAVPIGSQFSSVSVSLTTEAQEKWADNRSFSPHDMQRNLKSRLGGKRILNDSADKPLPTLEVQVKDMRTRSTFTAIMFGAMAGADSLTGDVIIKDSAGKELDRFEISASYALGGSAGGQEGTRMGWLYGKFADHMIKELTAK